MNLDNRSTSGRPPFSALLLVLVAASSLNSFVAEAYYNLGMFVKRPAFSTTWPFTAGTDSEYEFGASIELSGGVARLKSSDQTDDDNSAAGFAGGTASGVVWDGTGGVLRLGNAGGCDGTAEPCSRQADSAYELSSSWAPQWSNLIAYWGMNNNWNDSKGTNHAVSSTASFTSAGRAGSHAGYFNGTSGYTDFGNILDFTSGDFTFSEWIKVNSYATPVYAFKKGGDMVNGYLLQPTAADIQFNSSQSGAKQTITAPVSMTAGTWYHLAVTRTGSTLVIYLNGAQVGSGTISNPASAATDSFYLGAYSPTQWSNVSLDEVAVWNAALTASEIQSIYDRQVSGRSGAIASRVMDAWSPSQSWTSLRWASTLPFLKALPDYTSSVQNETSTTYPSLVGSSGSTSDNNLMTGIKGLWHLDESSGTLADRSGNGGTGTAVGGATLGQAGLLSYAPVFDGTTGYVNVGQAAAIDSVTSASHSMAAWFNPTFAHPDYLVNTSLGGGLIFGRRGNHTGIFALKYGGLNLVQCLIYNSSGTPFDVNSAVTANAWHHVSMTVDDTAKVMKCFLDGALAGQITYTGSLGSYAGVDYLIGAADPSAPLTDGNYAYFFNGKIDEVALWSRELHATEVQQLYRRGANRIKHQVRVCTAADCSDDPAGANWKGPDGTSNTFFSELFNMTAQAATPSGTVNISAPVMTFANFTSPIGTSRYFQYRTILESDSASTSCNYGAGATACSPELKSVAVDPVHIDSSSPTLVGKAGAPYSSVASFTQTLGSTCPSGIGYNLGSGATYSTATWYWWDSSKATGCAGAGTGAWCPSDGTVAKSNDAATLSSYVPTYAAQVGSGTVYFKAFLKGTGSSACELDRLDMTGKR